MNNNALTAQHTVYKSVEHCLRGAFCCCCLTACDVHRVASRVQDA